LQGRFFKKKKLNNRKFDRYNAQLPVDELDSDSNSENNTEPYNCIHQPQHHRSAAGRPPSDIQLDSSVASNCNKIKIAPGTVCAASVQCSCCCHALSHRKCQSVDFVATGTPALRRPNSVPSVNGNCFADALHERESKLSRSEISDPESFDYGEEENKNRNASRAATLTRKWPSTPSSHFLTAPSHTGRARCMSGDSGYSGNQLSCCADSKLGLSPSPTNASFQNDCQLAIHAQHSTAYEFVPACSRRSARMCKRAHLDEENDAVFHSPMTSGCQQLLPMKSEQKKCAEGQAKWLKKPSNLFLAGRGKSTRNSGSTNDVVIFFNKKETKSTVTLHRPQSEANLHEENMLSLRHNSCHLRQDGSQHEKSKMESFLQDVADECQETSTAPFRDKNEVCKTASDDTLPPRCQHDLTKPAPSIVVTQCSPKPRRKSSTLSHQESDDTSLSVLTPRWVY